MEEEVRRIVYISFIVVFSITLINAQTSIDFKKIWESAPSQDNVWDTAVEDFDYDNFMEVIFPSFVVGYDPILHVFKNVGDDNLEEIWSGEVNGYGVIKGLTTDDLDNDGYKEIVVGHYNSRINFFESDGNNNFVEWPEIYFYDGKAHLIIGDISTGDTNNNNLKEVLIIREGMPNQYFHESSLTIFENYQNIFQYDTQGVSYFRMDVGFLDSDEYQDILVSHGGLGIEEFWLDWFEYTGSTYVKRIITAPGLNGLPLTLKIADIDLDGSNELVVAGVFGGLRKLLIFEPNGNNQVVLDNEVEFPSTTNPMDISIKNIFGSSYPEIAVSTHSSGGIAQVFLFSYNGENYNLIYSSDESLPESSGAFYSIDLAFVDNDDKPGIVLGVGPPNNKVIILEEDSLPDISINITPNNPPIEVSQGGSFTYTGVLTNNLNETQTADVWIMLRLPQEEPNTCTDSDGGLNYFTYGYTEGYSNNQPYQNFDVCDTQTILSEQYCEINNSFSQNKSCLDFGQDYICENGSCVQQGNETNQTGIVTDITGYTNPDSGIIDFQAITNGSISYVKFQINFNGSVWQNIGNDQYHPYIVSWSDNVSRQNVRIQAIPFYNNVSGQGRTEGPFQYLGNQTTPNCADSDGGLNYFLKGHVFGNNENGTYNYWDVCNINNATLKEYYCVNNSYYLYNYHNCGEMICSDGACLNGINYSKRSPITKPKSSTSSGSSGSTSPSASSSDSSTSVKESVSATGKVVLDKDFSKESLYGPISVLNDIHLEPGQSISSNITQNVPFDAPLGEYEYIAYVGNYPDLIIDSASFSFNVIPNKEEGAKAFSALTGNSEWDSSGWIKKKISFFEKFFNNLFKD